MVLANAAAGKANNLAFGLSDGTRAAELHGVIEGILHELGIICLLHLGSHLAFLDVFGIAPHETLGGRPKLDILTRPPTSDATPGAKDIEVGDMNFGANVIGFATELTTIIDNHSNELLHMTFSFGELMGIAFSLTKPIL